MYVYLSAPTINPLLVRANGESFSPSSTIHEDSSIMDDENTNSLSNDDPLNALIDAAHLGNVKLVENYGNIFLDHTKKLIQVKPSRQTDRRRKRMFVSIQTAQTACLMSNQVEGAKLVRLAIMQIEDHSVQVVFFCYFYQLNSNFLFHFISKQVINAAEILSTQSTSKIARENLNVSRETWQKYLCLLTEAIDDITTMEDYLAISEKHILDDIDKCLQGTIDQNLDRKSNKQTNEKKKTMKILRLFRN